MSGLYGKSIYDRGIQLNYGIGGVSILPPKSIQTVTDEITSGSSKSVTITAVDTSNTIIIGTQGGANRGDHGAYAVRWSLVSSTAISMSRGVSSGATSDSATFSVIEFFDGAIQSTQYRTVTITAGNDTATTAITSVSSANSTIIPCGATATGVLGSSATMSYQAEYTFDSDTVLRASTLDAQSFAPVTFGVLIVEWVPN